MSWLGKIPTKNLYVTEMTPEVKQYNALVESSEKIKTKQETAPFQFDWILPKRYKILDVKEYVLDQLGCFEYDDAEMMKRIHRVIKELTLFEKYGYTDVLRCLIYIVEVLEDNQQVWGVGRGSSVSSYVLYLIGVHEIDSFKYNLPIDDFLKHTD